MPLPKTCRDRNSDGRNMLQLEDGYVYQIADPKVDRYIYDELSGSRWYVLGVFRIWGYWMQANRKLLAIVKNRQVNGNIRDFNSEKETWQSILLSSQKHYPINVLKPWHTETVHGVECRVMRLTVEKANEIFGT